jgi:hypothetical protein
MTDEQIKWLAECLNRIREAQVAHGEALVFLLKRGAKHHAPCQCETCVLTRAEEAA